MKQTILTDYFDKCGKIIDNYSYEYLSPNLEITVFDKDEYIGTYSVITEEDANSWAGQVQSSVIVDMQSTILPELLPYFDLDKFTEEYLPTIDIWNSFGRLLSTHKYKGEIYYIIEITDFMEVTDNQEVVE